MTKKCWPKDIAKLRNAKQVEKELRKNLGKYNKTNLNPDDFPLDLVVDACKRAKELDETIAGGDIPESNTTRVYLLWKAIVAKALKSQLPPALADLIDEKS